MTAPLAHPLVPAAAADVSDARLERALKTLARVMAKHPRGGAAMPVFERLEAEYDARRNRRERFQRFLEEK